MTVVKCYDHEIHIEADKDEDSSNPRTESDNLGTMICFHRRYSLGDTHSLSVEEAKKIEESDDNISLPLYLYDHSGITMNTTGFSCGWDSGKVGFIYVNKEQIRREYSWKKLTTDRIEKIEEYLRNEVKTYDHYLTGDVYRYETKDADGEVIDSCCGFYGYDHERSGLLQNARGCIPAYADMELLNKTPIEDLPLLVNRNWSSYGLKEFEKRLSKRVA